MVDIATRIIDKSQYLSGSKNFPHVLANWVLLVNLQLEFFCDSWKNSALTLCPRNYMSLNVTKSLLLSCISWLIIAKGEQVLYDPALIMRSEKSLFWRKSQCDERKEKQPEINCTMPFTCHNA